MFKLAMTIYGHFLTGEEQQIEPDLNEEAMHADGDQVVPDTLEEWTMVMTSAEVFLVSDCSNTIVGFFTFILCDFRH